MAPKRKRSKPKDVVETQVSPDRLGRNQKEAKMRRKVIIDADPGTDDASAILTLLRNSDVVEVVAITVTQGNTSLENASKNALRILNHANRLDIPVFAGSNASILNFRVQSDFYFGLDGMGDVVSPEFAKFDHKIHVQAEGAVQALIRLAKEHEKQITLLCIGPVTNVAVAQKVDYTFGGRLKEIVVMGGNYLGRGNITTSAEFNFYRDPEAAQVVLTQLKCPVTLITWELCLSLNLTWEWYDSLVSKNTKNSNFLKAIGAKMKKQAKAAGLKNYVSADEIAAAYIVKNELAIEKQQIVCQVELAGQLTRGQMVVDWEKSEKEGVEKNVTLIKKVHVGIFQSILEDMVTV